MWKFIGLALTMSAVVFANPSSELEFSVDYSGTYRSSGWSHYQDGKVTLKAWANHYVMNAVLMRSGRLHDVELTLRPVGDHFQGDGFITVRYFGNYGCRHRVGARVWIQDEKLFLRENTPGYIPYNPNSACQPAGPYQWFNHPDAYVKQ